MTSVLTAGLLAACSGSDDTDAGTADTGVPPRDAGTTSDAGTLTEATCTDYCDTVMTNCTGANELYADVDACMAACAVIPTGGNPGDTDGNSLNCRTYHAGAAKDDAALHCPHSTINGGGVCGDYCEVYCDFSATHCTGANEVFADEASCLSACAAFPTDGAPTAVDGNSVQCRIYHASFPAAADGALHCPHTSTNGGGVCGTPCDAYCDQALANCSGANELYADRAACMTACAVLPDTGDFNATSGNSVQCRTYHASFPAAADGALHCPHVSINGGGVCGDYCDVYCDFVESSCSSGGTQLFPGMDAAERRAPCLAACAAFPTDGAPTAVDGNSAQCRIYHASFPAAGDSALHCPHASTTGGTVCGTLCDAYCDQSLQNCDGTYADRAACMNSCGVMPTGAFSDTGGDTVQCRTYHSSFPAAADSALHCPHASITGGGVCGSLCEVYCNHQEAQCGFGMGGTQQYADRAACDAACPALATDGLHTATSGDSVQCRIYHASYPASQDSALHCPHSGADGSGVCVGM